MARALAFLYGLAAYLVFLAAFLYAVGFVDCLIVPKDIDSGTVVGLGEALTVNLLLLSLFAVQHSLMARKSFKAWWTRIVPVPVERSTYVLFASLILLLLFWQWRPIPAAVWTIEDPSWTIAIFCLYFAGWAVVLLSSFMINHFELFGLQQVAYHLAGKDTPPLRFKSPLFYRLVRHPIYLGFTIAFWATPEMTVGHLLFAAVTTGYLLIGIAFEERDLIESFGDEYRNYRRRVRAFLPFRRGRA